MKALAKKMISAVNDIDAVTKAGKNKAQDYNYVRAADVANEVRKVLVKHGIGFLYSGSNITNRSVDRIKEGVVVGSMNYADVEVDITFTDAESGESATVKSYGCGQDTGEKAVYKAMTGALKYALRMNFLIPDESDPENDSDEKPMPPIPTNSHKPEDESQDHPKPGSLDAQGKDAVSEGKARRFWAIAKSTGKHDEEIKSALGAAGLSDIKNCPWKGDTYERLVEWAGTR